MPTASCHLIIADLTRETGQDLQRAAVRALRAQGTWQIDSCLPRLEAVRRRLRDGPPVLGVVAHVASPGLADLLIRARLPVVNTSAILLRSPFVRVCVDARAAGRLLGEHLRRKGLDHAVHVIARVLPYSRDRHAGLMEILGEDNLVQLRFDGGEPSQTTILARQLQMALAGRTPAALILDGGQRAQACYAALDRLGLSVPQAVQVFGFNADPTYCESLHPTLSAVEMPSAAIGRRAVAVLLDLLAGRPPPTDEIRIAPEQVIERGSSDGLVCADVRLRAALAVIEAAQGDISVPQVVAVTRYTRRLLEGLFRRHLGRSPHAHIRQVRLARVQRLLRDTDQGVMQIAITCGFASGAHLAAVFKAYCGCSPSAWRARQTGAGDS